MKRIRFALGLLLALAATYGIVACGGDDSTPVVVVPPDPTLSLVAIQPVGGPRWEPGGDTCVEVGRDPKQTIAVLADTNFKLRPTGACGSLSQCGSLLLRLDPSGDTEAVRIQVASETLEIAFDSLPLGPHTFRVELLNKSGKNVIDTTEDSSTSGGPLFTEVTLDVTAAGDCGGTIADGGDAATDADTDASDGGLDASDASEDATEAGEAGDDASDANGDSASDSGEAGASDASSDAPSDTASSG